MRTSTRSFEGKDNMYLTYAFLSNTFFHVMHLLFFLEGMVDVCHDARPQMPHCATAQFLCHREPRYKQAMIIMRS